MGGHGISAAFDSKTVQLIFMALILMVVSFYTGTLLGKQLRCFHYRSSVFHLQFFIRLGNMTTNERGDLFSAAVVQVLDVGCGVASCLAYLLPLDIQTVSFVPKDGHENQIQFALERGIGGMISALATKAAATISL